MAEKTKILELKGSLSINDADSIRERMLAVIAEKQAEITVDISCLEDIDISIYQLLFALYKEAAKQNKKITFSGTVKDNLKKKLYTCGFISTVSFSDIDTDRVLKEKMEAALC